MKKNVVFACVFLSVAAFTASAFEQTLRLWIGPTWPREMLETEQKTAWNAGVAAGVTVDRKIGIGGEIDFLWQVNRQEEEIDDGISVILDEQKTFMWPILGYLYISPIPDFLVYPVIEGQIGFNLLYYKGDLAESQPTAVDDDFDRNGLYLGLIGKAIADAHVRIGDNSSLFAGLAYTWSNPSKTKKIERNGQKLKAHRAMRGLAIRMGIALLY